MFVTDKKGIFAYEVGSIEGTENHEYSCYTWCEANKANKVAEMNVCPFMYRQAKKMKIFKRVKEANNCLENKFAKEGIKYKCCYNMKGKNNGRKFYITYNVNCDTRIFFT